MNKAKQGRVSIRWNRDRGRSDSHYRPDIEITLIKSSKREGPDAGFVLRLAKTEHKLSKVYRVMGLQIRSAADRAVPLSLDLENIDALLGTSPMQMSISDKRYDYIRGLVESIKLRARTGNAAHGDVWVYKLRIKRAEMDIQLEWSDGEAVWPGIMDLVQALEEIYHKLKKNQNAGA